jgi:hypothetical protein
MDTLSEEAANLRLRKVTKVTIFCEGLERGRSDDSAYSGFRQFFFHRHGQRGDGVELGEVFLTDALQVAGVVSPYRTWLTCTAARRRLDGLEAMRISTSLPSRVRKSIRRSTEKRFRR